MTIESALIFFVAMLIFAVTPGPGVFAILATSLRFGTLASLPLAFGMAVSDIVYLVAACLGLAALAESGHILFVVIRYLGAAYLILLGWQMWHSPAIPAEAGSATSTSAKRTPHSVWKGGAQGFLISASNPKVILFYLAFLPTFLDLGALAPGDIVLASLLAFAALMLGLIAVAWLAASAGRRLQTPEGQRRINRTAGIIMGSAGVYLGVRTQ